MNVQCAECGLKAVITRIDSKGRSFEMLPGYSLDQMCPVAIKRKQAGTESSEPWECPNLENAIEKRIEKFNREHE